jgi:hypothetical protein
MGCHHVIGLLHVPNFVCNWMRPVHVATALFLSVLYSRQMHDACIHSDGDDSEGDIVNTTADTDISVRLFMFVC